MALEDLAATVLFLSLVAYAVFGGADFGAGVWTGLASGPRARAQRQALFEAMGPVWETNHVWLILAIVTLFTAFPSVFADLFIALLVPLVIAVVGIVFRGAAFAFRHFAYGGAGLPATAAVFSVASVVTPLAMGMALGAIASGDIRVRDGEVTSGLWEPWLQPFAVVCGLIAVAMCGFLTASYMTVRTKSGLQDDFRKRALAASAVLGALTALAIPVALVDAKPFWDELRHPFTIAVMSLAFLGGVASLVILWRRHHRLAPPIAAGTVALVLAGWASAQYPYLILPTVRVADAAAEEAVLRSFLVALSIGALILVPSLILLYATLAGTPVGPTARRSGSAGERADRL